MASDPLDLIKHNLQEMYCAVQTSPEKPVTLVAWGDKLYSAQSSWTGRIIAWIDSVVSFLINPNFGKSSVQRAIIKTHELFQEHKRVLEFQIREAEQALEQWTREELPDLKRFNERYQPILKYSETTRPFIKLLFHNNLRLKELLATYINAENTYFHDNALYNRTGHLAHIHDLICNSGGSLPIKAFKQALQKPKLADEENKAIKRWVKKMRRLQGTIDNRALCKGLSSLVDFWNLYAHDFHASDIEEHLMLYHPDYLLPDPKHIQWRSTWQEGKQIVIDPKHFFFTLCEPIKPKTEGFDNSIAFAIKDHSSIVIVAQNRAVLKMRQRIRQNPTLGLYGIRSCNYLYVDPKGRFALAEHLKPVQDPRPLIGQLRWLVKQPYTPSDLNFRHLSITHSGYLVSVKSHGKAAFNYNSLEQLAFDFANGNKKLYQIVIQDSNLTSLPHARYFRECILKGLYQEDINVNRLVELYSDESSLPHDIWMGEDTKTAQKLYQEARQSVIELRKSLVRIEEIHTKLFEKVLKEELHHWWQMHCQAGRFWPNFKIEVAIQVAERLGSGSVVN